MAANGSGSSVVAPPRACEIPAHHALDREHVEPPADHRPPVLADLEQVIRCYLARAREPEAREPGEDSPFVRDRCRENHVESGDPIARDERESVIAERVDLTDLAARNANCPGGHACTSSLSATSARSRVKTTSACRVNASISNVSLRSTRVAISASAR